MNETPLTAVKLRELLEYDSGTGLFRRRKKPRKGSAEWLAGTINNWGHYKLYVSGRLYQSHRLAWLYVHGCWPDGEIDHIDGDKANNKISNLRDVTRQVNQQNISSATRKKKSCNLLGAYKSGNGWMALIKHNRKQTYLGYFKSPQEAHAAYVAAKRVMHKGCTI